MNVKLKLNQSVVLFIAGIIVGVGGIVVKFVYRPFVVGNNLSDLGLQEFLPSLLYVLGFCLFGAGVARKRPLATMAFITLGALAYEFEQYWTTYVFDWKDVIAILAGFLIAVFTNFIIGNSRHFNS